MEGFKEKFSYLESKPNLWKLVYDIKKEWDTYSEETKNDIALNFAGEKEAQLFKEYLNQLNNNIDITTSIEDALVWKEKDSMFYQELVPNCEVTEYKCKNN